MFVLNVDLWNADGSKEVNLVRHSSGTPSISSTTPASYGSLTSSTPAFANILPSNRESSYPGSDMGGYGQPVMPQYGMPQGYPQAAPPYGQGPQPGYQCEYLSDGHAIYRSQEHKEPLDKAGYPRAAVLTLTYLAPYMAPHGYAPANQYYPNQGMPVGQLPSNAAAMGQYPPTSPGYGDMTRVSNSQPQGMFTRNLIGSLAASAFRLTDNNDKIGIWFVLQDLSVRTEGNFR